MKKTLYVFLWAFISLLVLPVAAQVPAYVPTDGLVGWWPFNGNANDESGNGNDGVVNDCLGAADRIGNPNSALQFSNGCNVSIPMTNQLFELPQRTFTCWFRANGSQNGGRIYETTFQNAGIGLYSGNLFDTWYGYSQHCCNITGLDGGALGDWHHLVSIANDLTGFTQVYLDGNEIATSNGYPAGNGCLSNSNWQWQGQFLRFGLGASNEAFNGELDDIAIYNRALTAQEIQNLYTGTTPPPCVSLPSNLQQGLVGYWPFCGNANDESGNGNDGTVNGATLTEDRFGNANAAYGFDGLDDFIELPNSYLIDSLYDFSVSAWVFSNNLNANFQHLISKDTMGPPPNGDWDFYLRNNRFKFEITLNSPTFEQQSNAVLQENTWHHLQMVREASSGVVSLYVNGIFDSSFIGHTGANYNFQKMVFGKQGSSNLHFFNGTLDDIGIWNRALTPEEVQELYTLDACTFTVYDTTYVTVYDTLTTYETVYDTLYTYETIYDTVTTYVTVTDTLLIDITFVGFEGQPSWLNTVSVFPNPASDHITIDYGNFALLAGYNTIITDAAGAIVYSSAVNSQQADIDINAWGAAGVYYMTIYDASGAAVAVRHIVLQ